MKIATFNINGIKARIEALSDWLQERQPDVALLQEIKSVDDGFPRQHFEDMGYAVETHGQKGFNGVAILSRLPLEDVSRGLPGDDADDQARWIEATVIGSRAVRLCCLYLPNGNPAPGPKYAYKLAWMSRLEARMRALLAEEMPVVFAGDYNVIPQADDVRRPEAWREDALFRPDTRAAFRRLVNLGLTEAFRARHAGPGHYSFWDYQAGAWDRNDGIRIDHHLLTPQAADLMTDVWIEAGGARPREAVGPCAGLDRVGRMRLALALVLCAGGAQAQCRIQTTGSNCVAVPQSQRSVPLVAPGDMLERGEYRMLFGTLRYGLPPPADGWVYFRIGRDIARVQLDTLEVLEIVTDQANRAFR